MADSGRGRGDPAADYISLLKGSLTGAVHGRSFVLARKPEKIVGRDAALKLERDGLEIVRRCGPDEREALQQEGRGWPLVAETMVGMKRLDNVERCVEEALQAGVAGDLIEAGAWRGGATILMRGILRARGVQDRCVWVADSFAGLPPPDPGRYPADAGDVHHTIRYLAVDADEVRDSFRRYGLLDGQVQFLEGWFRDTLPTLSKAKWAVVRIDGDMYESTMDALTWLYPNLSPGGFLIVDDYGAIPACARAVDDYRREHSIAEPMEQIDWAGVYWQRSE